jgi:hypothetical protein
LFLLKPVSDRLILGLMNVFVPVEGIQNPPGFPLEPTAVAGGIFDKRFGNNGCQPDNFFKG